MDFMISSAAALGAVIVTNPLDVIKTRLQLQGELQAPGNYTKVYTNVLQSAIQMVKLEGVRSLQRGVWPAALYQVFMNGPRLSLYQMLDDRGFLQDKDGKVSSLRCAVGATGVGLFSGFIASPLYLAKVQLQSQADPRLAVGTQHNYTGVYSSLKSAVETGGISGLYRGASTSLYRVGVMSSSQLFTNTQCRSALHNLGICPMESWSNALAGAMLSGVAVTAAMTPFDVIATRLYNQGVDGRGKGLLYTSVPNCFKLIVRTEGPAALYKGWQAVYLRIGPHSFIILMLWDVFKKMNEKWQNPETSSRHLMSVSPASPSS